MHVYVRMLYVRACKVFLIVLYSVNRSTVEKSSRLSRKIPSIIEAVREIARCLFYLYNNNAELLIDLSI